MGKKPAQRRILLCPKVCLFLGLAGAQETGSVSLTRKALSWVLAGCCFSREIESENEEHSDIGRDRSGFSLRLPYTYSNVAYSRQKDRGLVSLKLLGTVTLLNHEHVGANLTSFLRMG